MNEPTPHTSLDGPAAAIRALMTRLRPVSTEAVRLESAAARFLAQDAVTDRPSPASDVSAMDGYALRLADARLGRLPIAGELPIGQPPRPLPARSCLRIVTGAPVPADADVVVKREDVEEYADTIRISAEAVARLKLGENIRRRGDNAPAGAPLARSGDLVTPALAGGGLATFGLAEVRVHRAIGIAIISTGDEVLDVQATPTEWQLRDGNGPALRALFAGRPWASVSMHERVGDDEGAIRAAIARAVESCDAVLLSGGVSMGHRDFVPAAIRAVGGEVVYHKLPQRPGRPMLGAVVGDSRVIFGLPGNPLSVLTTAVRIALPVLRRLAGSGGESPDGSQAVVEVVNAGDKAIDLWWFRPVRLTGNGRAELVPMTGSGDVIAMAASGGFVEVPPGGSGRGPWPYYPWAG